MKFIADLHIHSRYSRATAKNLNLETLYVEAQRKGLTVVATGDFTHPAWFTELEEKLVPAEAGLFELKPELAAVCDDSVPPTCRGKVRFLLETEISNIYKKADRTRKNHNLVFMPDLESARGFNQRLEQIGNIHSDGRPILGMDARDLLEIVLETGPEAHLIPAHVWTPWFSLLGSKSGFDTVEACFGDLSEHIFALETGLSSDPPMNWRIEALDRYSLISNSDAHSPAKLGREANCFDTELSYTGIFEALKDLAGDTFRGTLEFYPEEGKYHVDGHRKCGVQLFPRETRIYEGICPVCGKPLVLGVLHRVEELADRARGFRPATGADYHHLVPLEDILAQLLRVGPKSKKVVRARNQLLETFGPELNILQNLPLEALTDSKTPHLSEAVRRMRQHEITFSPGYDGEYGRLQIFSPDEWQQLDGQRQLFNIPEALPANVSEPELRYQETGSIDQGLSEPLSRVLETLDQKETAARTSFSAAIDLNPEQQAVVDHESGPLIVVAGPGTGKTRVLTERIVHLVNDAKVSAAHILAVTFTQKAAEEMQERLKGRLGSAMGKPLVATFHGLCLQLLQEDVSHEGASHEGASHWEGSADEGVPSKKVKTIVSAERQRGLMADALSFIAATKKRPATAASAAGLKVKEALAAVSAVKQGLLPPDAPAADLMAAAGGLDVSAVYPIYQRLLELHGGYDYDDLIFQAVMRLEHDDAYRIACRQRFTHIFVDEYQDLNASQYRIVRALCPAGSQICVIGDPDQAIYGFRGARRVYFNNFLEDYPAARVIHLRRNYRSVQTVLSAAFQVIAHQHINLMGSDDGQPMAMLPGSPLIGEISSATERSEAVAIGKIIEEMIGGTGFHHLDFGSVKDQAAARQRSFGDFAVLYRTHQQGEQLAEILGKGGIPCQVASRRHMLDLPPVAALIALVQLLNSSAAFYDFELAAGALNTGIGPKTIQQLKTWAYHKGFGLAEALAAARRVPLPGISLARQQGVFDFIQHIEKLRRQMDPLTLIDQLRYLVGQTPLGALFEGEVKAPHALAVLLSRAADHHQNRGTFLESLALIQDSDSYDPRAERVTLLTLHAAKGLEFPVVFIAGFEDGLLPFRRSSNAISEVTASEDANLDEEGRLLYVGMTRARQLLFLSRAQKRRIYGKMQVRESSPFLAAIDKNLLTSWDRKAPKQAPPRQQQMGLFD